MCFSNCAYVTFECRALYLFMSMMAYATLIGGRCRNSERAVCASILVVRVFILREMSVDI